MRRTSPLLIIRILVAFTLIAVLITFLRVSVINLNSITLFIIAITATLILMWYFLKIKK